MATPVGGRTASLFLSYLNPTTLGDKDMKLLVVLASGIGAYLGQLLGCGKIFYRVAFDNTGHNLEPLDHVEQSIKWMNLWCDEGSKYLLGVGFVVGCIVGGFVASEGRPRLGAFLSLICGFIGAVITAFVYAHIELP
jgi:hypothetical protein